MKTRKAKIEQGALVNTVFEQLKTSGLTNNQIVSFATELTNLAHGAQNQPKSGTWLESLMEYDLSLLGLPRQG